MDQSHCRWFQWLSRLKWSSQNYCRFRHHRIQHVYNQRFSKVSTTFNWIVFLIGLFNYIKQCFKKCYFDQTYLCNNFYESHKFIRFFCNCTYGRKYSYLSLNCSMAALTSRSLWAFSRLLVNFSWLCCWLYGCCCCWYFDGDPFRPFRLTLLRLFALYFTRLDRPTWQESLSIN